MIDVYIWIGVWVVILIMLIISLTKIENRIAEDGINKMFEYLKKRKKERLAMPRSIDADELKKCSFVIAYKDERNITQYGEFVEVVRCKDCKWFDLTDPCGTLTPNAYRCKRVTRLWMEKDAYCSYGERSEE